MVTGISLRRHVNLHYLALTQRADARCSWFINYIWINQSERSWLIGCESSYSLALKSEAVTFSCLSLEKGFHLYKWGWCGACFPTQCQRNIFKGLWCSAFLSHFELTSCVAGLSFSSLFRNQHNMQSLYWKSCLEEYDNPRNINHTATGRAAWQSHEHWPDCDKLCRTVWQSQEHRPDWQTLQSSMTIPRTLTRLTKSTVQYDNPRIIDSLVTVDMLWIEVWWDSLVTVTWCGKKCDGNMP